MAPTSLVQNLIWTLAPVLQVAILLVMWRRKLVQTFPLFFSYTAFHLIDGLLGVVIYRYPMAYFWFYWGGEGVDALLTLAVIQEVFTVTFAPYEALRKYGLLIFRCATVLLCIVAVGTAVIAPSGEINKLMDALYKSDRSVQIVELGLLFFLFVFCRLFGMGWRHYVFGIAAGLIVAASIGMAALAIRTHVGQAGNYWFDFVAPSGYTLGILMWTYYFASEKSVVPLNIVPRTDQLIAWNQALSRVEQR